ncbi:UPF0104 family protein [Streptosporangiaceae bacterium NEAU-GS5]|nr:UPF0104 family protein [Streptosporangiaceae bacterium NEAU-GS5]
MRRRLRWVAVLGTAALAVYMLRDRIPDPAEVWRTIKGVSFGWLAVAVLFEAMSMSTFARLFRRLLTLGGARMTVGRAVAVTYARNALSNSLPAGPVLSIAYTTRQFGRLGANKPLIAATLVLSGIYSTATFVVLTLVALLGGPSTRQATGIFLAVLVLICSVAVRLRPRSLGSLMKRLNDRFPALAEQLRQAREAIRPGGRDRITLFTLALLNWLLDVACLAAVCAAAGVSVGPHTVLLGYVAAKGAATLALIPGGLGVAELGMAATFIAAGVAGGSAAAVVALYRLISYWAILLAGWVAWIALLDGFHAWAVKVGQLILQALIGLSIAMIPSAYVYREQPKPR